MILRCSRLLFILLALTVTACGDPSQTEAERNDLAETEASLIRQSESQLAPLLEAIEQRKQTIATDQLPAVALPADLSKLPASCQKYIALIQRCVNSSNNEALATQLQNQQQQLLTSPLASADNPQPFAAACQQALEAFIRVEPTLGCGSAPVKN